MINIEVFWVIVSALISIGITGGIIQYICGREAAKLERHRYSIWTKMDIRWTKMYIRAEKNAGEYTNRMHISSVEVVHTLNGIWTPDSNEMFEVHTYRYLGFTRVFKIGENVVHVIRDEP